MNFKSMAQSKVRRTFIECGAVVKDAGLRHVIAVASNEGGSSICLARTRHSTRLGIRGAGIGHCGNLSPEAVSWEAVATTYGAGAEIGVECVIVFRNVGIAAA